MALKRNQEQLVENQREFNEAQIRMLQAQLNPHFLCNTLDTMKWISKINQVPQVAPSCPPTWRTSCASASPRTSSSPCGGRWRSSAGTWRSSPSACRASAAWRWTCPRELEECRVPKMILQPLAENAILHGLDGVEDGVIWVRVRSQGTQTLTISVEDNGRGLPPGTHGTLYRPPETSGRGTSGTV